MSNELYHEQKIWPLAKVIREVLKQTPQAMDDEGYFRALLYDRIPQLRQKDRCVNCGASMLEYLFFVTILDVGLLVTMANVVRGKTESGMGFQEAERVHIPTLDASYTLRSRSTIASKLGLVAKAKAGSGRQQSGTWVITKRGWAFLRGQPVPAKVTVWRNLIEGRHEESTTLQGVVDKHRRGVEDAFFRGKQPQSDHRELVKDYKLSDWVEYGKAHEGTFI